ncbi:DUF4013 domain-containing protein [Methanosphaera sp. BMS]|uniref:DUF4013 domain-containing protein n=1 Tax=Methanosphaera sp. BMS TaxID=1789762 RepID=UPI000DC1ED54|nr:DUF4013 domain-containing protein [Methanosphaera sp. BMS]AWX31879.1 hypothetical protein AW729_01690 [Methanosphaera sp. BMS]
MDAIEIIKEALHYPIDNMKNWLIICIVFLLTGVVQQIALNSNNTYVNLLMHLINILIIIIIGGIFISIVKESISGSSEIPMLDPVENLILGIKSIIVQFIYLIIPALITLILSIPLGVFDKFGKIINAISTMNANSTINTTVNATNSVVIQSIPQNLIHDFVISIGILAIFCFILYVIFSLLSNISLGILAETEDILAALNIPAVISKINSIGWSNYIVFIILALLTVIVIGIISSVITLIPYIGRIIASFIVDAYLLTFMARAIGLIYNEG